MNCLATRMGTVMTLAALVACMTACAARSSPRGTTTAVTVPERPPAQAPSPAPLPPPAEPEEQPAEPTQRLSVAGQIPEGWEGEVDSTGAMVLHHASGSTISVAIYVSSLATPQEYVSQLWERAVRDSEGDSSLEVGAPMSMTQDGVDIAYLNVVRLAPDGTRISLNWVVFVSNVPEYSFLLVGVWPESMQDEMLGTLGALARSLQVRQAGTTL